MHLGSGSRGQTHIYIHTYQGCIRIWFKGADTYIYIHTRDALGSGSREQGGSSNSVSITHLKSRRFWAHASPGFFYYYSNFNFKPHVITSGAFSKQKLFNNTSFPRSEGGGGGGGGERHEGSQGMW